MSDPKDVPPVNDGLADGLAGDGVDAVDASVDAFAAEASDINSQIELLKTEVADANDRTLRVQAELENYRRRIRREMDESLRYANQPLLTDLLQVVDNIERATEAAEQNPGGDSSGLLEGVKIVSQQLISMLEKYHCVEVPAVGEPFDPSFHEAISQQPSEEYAAGTVALAAAKGYKLHERVIRPTPVIVSTGSAQ